MKKNVLMLLAAVLLLTGCDTYTGAGAATGGYFGAIIGSAIGGISDGRRGSDVGTLIGMLEALSSVLPSEVLLTRNRLVAKRSTVVHARSVWPVVMWLPVSVMMMMTISTRRTAVTTVSRLTIHRHRQLLPLLLLRWTRDLSFAMHSLLTPITTVSWWQARSARCRSRL